MIRVLLTDDDVNLCVLLKNYLENEDLRLNFVHDGNLALKLLFDTDDAHYDLLLLDVTLPGANGFEILKTIRERGSDIPILMLTAHGDPMDKVAGLEAGADDYISKPFDVRELAARITAALRYKRPVRNASEAQGDSSVLRSGDLEVDCCLRVARLDRQKLDLTETEYKLLEALLKVQGRPVSLSDLFRHVFDRPFSSGDRSLSPHVSHLRSKLGLHKNGEQRIRTIRGEGFIYVAPGERGEDK